MTVIFNAMPKGVEPQVHVRMLESACEGTEYQTTKGRIYRVHATGTDPDGAPLYWIRSDGGLDVPITKVEFEVVRVVA